MGCDIHLFVEKKIYRYDDKKKKKGVWVSADKWTLREDSDCVDMMDENNGENEFPKSILWPRFLHVRYEDRFYKGRNYNLFTALCGVRRESFNDEPDSISEPKGLPDDVTFPVELASDEWDGDGHSHSWNTLKELREFDWSQYGDTCDEFVKGTIPRLDKELYGEYTRDSRITDDDIRIVYWFDN